MRMRTRGRPGATPRQAPVSHLGAEVEEVSRALRTTNGTPRRRLRSLSPVPMRLALISLFFVVVLGVLLATQPANLENEVRLALPFVQADWTGSVLWMIAGWFGAGLALGYLIALPGRIGAARRASKIEKQLTVTQTERSKAVGALNTAAPARPATTEADEMQRLADEVARRTESTQRDAPPPPPMV